MVKLKDVQYSQDETVEAVREYYQFLCKMYLEDHLLLEPPPEGWPSITDERVRAIGKSDEVAALLRRLPYISSEAGYNYRSEIGSRFFCADWQCILPKNFTDETHGKLLESPQDIRLASEGVVAYEKTPPHVVGLTYGGTATYTDLLLDTKLGVIYSSYCVPSLAEATRAQQIEDRADSYSSESEWDWRWGGCPFPVKNFFKMLQNELLQLNSVPISHRQVFDVYSTGHFGDMIPTVAKIWREHGWPDSPDFDKRTCLVAVQRFLAEKHPLFHDWRLPYKVEQASDSEELAQLVEKQQLSPEE